MNMNEIQDTVERDNGAVLRIRLVAVAIGIVALIAGLWYVFDNVQPLALAILAVIVAGVVYLAVRLTRSGQRDHDAEVVQAGIQGMTTALTMAERIMRWQAAQLPAPPIPEQPEADNIRQDKPRLIAPLDDVWIHPEPNKPNELRRVNRVELPVERDTVTLRVNGEAGVSRAVAVPLAKVEAMVRCYPRPAQRTFVMCGGGKTESFAETGELLASCDPPLLLRSPERAGAFVFVADDWRGVQAWLDRHAIQVRRADARGLPSPTVAGDAGQSKSA